MKRRYWRLVNDFYPCFRTIVILNSEFKKTVQDRKKRTYIEELPFQPFSLRLETLWVAKTKDNREKEQKSEENGIIIQSGGKKKEKANMMKVERKDGTRKTGKGNVDLKNGKSKGNKASLFGKTNTEKQKKKRKHQDKKPWVQKSKNQI